MSAKDVFASMVRKGLETDIFKAEQAVRVVAAIGGVSADVNTSTFAPVFALLQSYATEQFVLAINRLLERPKNYSLRSLPGALTFLSKHAAEISLEQPVFFEQALASLGVLSADIRKTSGTDQATKIVEILLALLPVQMKASPTML